MVFSSVLYGQMHFDANIQRSFGLHFFWATTLTLDPLSFVAHPLEHPPLSSAAPISGIFVWVFVQGFCYDVFVTVIDADFLTVWMSKRTDEQRELKTKTETEIEIETELCWAVDCSRSRNTRGLRWQLWLVVWQFSDLNSIMTCKMLSGGPYR